MTNEELIEALTTLKEQAQHYGDNTFVWSINIDSFNFVIGHTIKALEQRPTTKNDLAVDAVSRQAVLDLIADYDLSMGQVVRGIHALPSVTPRLSSELEKDFGELDCISRADAIKAMQDKAKKLTNEDTINGLCGAVAILFDMPSVTLQEPHTFKWCTGCREYDQEKHCCHRWSKAIRDTVEEMKQEYIERDVLDKIRAEMEARLCDVVSDYTDGYRTAIQGDLAILDKYKAETEDKA